MVIQVRHFAETHGPAPGCGGSSPPSASSSSSSSCGFFEFFLLFSTLMTQNFAAIVYFSSNFHFSNIFYSSFFLQTFPNFLCFIFLATFSKKFITYFFLIIIFLYIFSKIPLSFPINFFSIFSQKFLPSFSPPLAGLLLQFRHCSPNSNGWWCSWVVVGAGPTMACTGPDCWPRGPRAKIYGEI